MRIAIGAMMAFMRRRSLLVTVPFLLVVPSVLGACGAAADKAAEEAAERAIEEAGGGNVEIDADGGEVKFETDEGTMTVDEDGNMVITDADGNVVTQTETEDGVTQISTDDGSMTIGEDSLPEGWPAPALPDGFTVQQGSSMSDASSMAWTAVASYAGSVNEACDALKASMSGWTVVGETTSSGASSFCAITFEDATYTWQATVADDSGATTAVLNVITK
jgi:hypothetical protein